MHPRRLLLVFARTPHEEASAKPLGARRRSERLHRALLDRALATAAAAGFPTRLVTTGDERETPPTSDAPSTRATPPTIDRVRQRGASFAERIERAVADAFAAGWNEVVVIGADAPRLDAAHIRDAFALLATTSGPRAVIGPAHDGGYYLLGLNRFDPSLFRGIPFCTPTTFAATVAALVAARFAVTTLAPLADVDTLDDVRRLATARGLLGRAARDLLAALIAPSAAVTRAAIRKPFLFVDARGPPSPLAALS